MRTSRGMGDIPGKLKPIDKSNPGLSKLPTEVRNKMGYIS